MAMTTARHAAIPQAQLVLGNDVVEREFMALNDLYFDIAKRQGQSACFLHRNLRYIRRPGARRGKAGGGSFSVRYTCGHSSVSWSKRVSEPRCLWCRNSTSIRFTQASQLMEHLRSCHSRLRYVLDSTNIQKAGTVVVEMKLLGGSAGVSAARVDKLKAWDTEAVYVNPKRYPRYFSDMCDVSGLGVWKTTFFVTKFRADDHALPLVLSNGNVEAGAQPSHPGENDEHMDGMVERTQRLELAELYALNRERLRKVVEGNRALSVETLNGFVSCYKPGGSHDGPGGANFQAGPTNSQGNYDGVQARPGSAHDDEDNASGSGSLNRSEGTGSNNVSFDGDENGLVAVYPSSERPNGAVGLGKPFGSKRKSSKRVKRNKGGDGVMETFMEGVERGILYSSVVQSMPSVEEFEAGGDSDAEHVIDEDWRLEVGDKLISEFVDTSAQEKMYMSLWNQYVLKEVYVYSDRRQLDVVCMFAQRHLGELYRRGLIDVTGIHQATVELGRARADAIAAPHHVDEQLSHFAFHSRIMSEDQSATK